MRKRAILSRPRSTWSAADWARLIFGGVGALILIGAGLGIPGGTALFRLARTPAAPALFQHLGRAGILVRNFPNNATWLRFGLPAGEEEWQRLQIAMDAFHNNG